MKIRKIPRFTSSVICCFFAVLAGALETAHLAAEVIEEEHNSNFEEINTSQGQEFPSSVGVYVWVEVKANAPGPVTFNARSEIQWHLEKRNLQKTDINFSGSASTPGEWVRDDKKHWLPISTGQAISFHEITGSNHASVRFHVVTPAEYLVYFYDETKKYYKEASAWTFSPTQNKQVLFMVKHRGERGSLAGKALDIMAGDTNLRLGLGYLANGQSAGYLDFNPVEHFGARDALGSYYLLYTYNLTELIEKDYRLDLPGRIRSPFYCFPTSPDVQVICEAVNASNTKAGRRIRQVIAPQAIVDIIREDDGAKHIIKFHDPKRARLNNKNIYEFSEEPFVQYLITTGGEGDSTWQCNITRTEGGTVQQASLRRDAVKEDMEYDDLVIRCDTYPESICWDSEYVCDYDFECTTYTYYDECGNEINSEEYCIYYNIACYWLEDCEDVDVEDCDGDFQSVSVEVDTPRSVLVVRNFTGTVRVEEGASYNDAFDATSSIKGDFYHAIHTSNGTRLMGRYGAPLINRFRYGLYYKTPEYTSTYEVAYDLPAMLTEISDNAFKNLKNHNIDFERYNAGQTTRRKYYDVFDFDPDAEKYPGRLFYEERPGRSWRIIDYHKSLDKIGLASKIVAPYKDTLRPSDMPAPNEAGYRIQTIDYAPDWDDAVRLPSIIESWVDGKLTSVTSHEYSTQPAIAGNSVWRTITREATMGTSGSVLTTVSKAYLGKNVDPLYRGLPVSESRPDGTKTSYAYAFGEFDENGDFQDGNDTERWYAWSIFGKEGNGTRLFHSMEIDPLDLIDGYSTAEAIIRNAKGLIIGVEKYIYDNGSWVKINWEARSYDVAGNLLRTESSNGAIAEYEYTDINDYEENYSRISFANTGTPFGRLMYSKDVNGVITQYNYDDYGRISSTLRLAMPSAAGVNAGLPALRTSYIYDAENRITQIATGEPNGEQLITKLIYDYAGRLIEKTEEGLVISYEIARANGQILQVIEKCPDGGTIITRTNRDGTLQSQTGTALVPVYYSYDMDDAIEVTTSHIASSNSARWTKVWTDGFGRTVKTQSPSPTTGTIEDTFTYNAKGQLIKSTTTDMATTLYEYDLMGRLVAKGQDINNDGMLNTGDRRTSYVSDYRQHNNAWWRYDATQVYPGTGNDADTPKNQQQTWTRLTGFDSVVKPASPVLSIPGIALSEVIAHDIAGNESRGIIFLDRSSGAESHVATRPLASQPDVTRKAAGTPLKHTSPSGVVEEFFYDPLGPLEIVSDRTRPSGATWKNFSYVPGSSRLYENRDNNGGTLVVRYGYDAAGRVISEDRPSISYETAGKPTTSQSGDALSRTNRKYDTRGKLTHAWGDNTYPVQYEYNAYGDQTSQRTYRAFPDSGLDGWPASPGTGDTTQHEYYETSGWLKKTTDAAGRSTHYEYDTRGRLLKTTSPRGIVTTRSYATATGELLEVTYSDNTPAITYTYDHMGRQLTVSDATGVRSFAYVLRAELTSENLPIWHRSIFTISSACCRTGI